MEYQSGMQDKGAGLAYVTKDDMGTGGFSVRVIPRAVGPDDLTVRRTSRGRAARRSPPGLAARAQRATYIQQYITPPLLAAGRKFDCRIFALVPSFDPLRVYVGTEGYIRRTLVDDDGDLTNPLTQITNNMYAVRRSPLPGPRPGLCAKSHASGRAPSAPGAELGPQKQYARDTDETLLRYVRAPLGGEERNLNSTKWSMRALLEYASEELRQPQARVRQAAHAHPAPSRRLISALAARLQIWARVREAISRTLASVAPSLSCTHGRVPYPCGSAFHVFGVDVVFRGCVHAAGRGGPQSHAGHWQRRHALRARGEHAVGFPEPGHGAAPGPRRSGGRHGGHHGHEPQHAHACGRERAATGRGAAA